MRTAGGFREATWDEALDFTAGGCARSRRSTARTPSRSTAAPRSPPRRPTCWASSRASRSARGTSTTTAACAWSRRAPPTSSRFGVDRSPNPWSDIPKAAGGAGRSAPTSASARRSRPTTSGAPATTAARLIVADPRMTPITRNADLYLPVRPGTDLALLLGMLHVILRDGLENRDFIDSPHHRLRGRSPNRCEAWDPATRGARSPACRRRRSRRRRTGSASAERAMALHARGIEHQSKGVENCLARDQPSRSPPATSAAKAPAAS